MRAGRVLTAVVLAGVLSISSVVLAGRPLAIDDADPVAPGQFEFEAGAAYEHDSDQWVGEVFAGRELAGGADTVAQYNTGFRWNPVENLTLDIAGGSRISGDAPDFTGTVGLTWAFGFKNNQSK